jgi:hypothetical protein
MRDHDVLLYGNDAAALNHCVVPFIASAVQDSGAAIVIAGEDHERWFRSELTALGIDLNSATTRDRLIFLNANDTLRRLTVNGRIERSRFSRVIGDTVRKLSRRFNVHAYGEMVGILRSIGKPQAAAYLEDLWNELLHQVPFRLLCGYSIDVLDSEFAAEEMEVILTSHSRLIESSWGERTAAIRGIIESMRRPGWDTVA